MAKKKETRYAVHGPFEHREPDPDVTADVVTLRGCGCEYRRLPDGTWEFHPALSEDKPHGTD